MCTFSTSKRQKRLKSPSFWHFWLPNVLRAETACIFATWQLPKVVREWCVLYILTWKCASRHNGVHFFDIWTSKSGLYPLSFLHFWLENVLRASSCHSGVHFFDILTSKSRPDVVCFVHFDLEMCFAPQRRAILNLWSGQLAPHPLL